MPALTLYDLSGSQGRRFSPFGWRARMALAHKGLHDDCAVELVRFTEKAKLGFSGQTLVPVLVDGETVVPDSWAIAEHLEAGYPDRPSLFAGTEGGLAGRSAARFVTGWVETELHPRLAPLIVTDILDVLDPEDRPYFRESREPRFGTTLEALRDGRDGRLDGFRRALEPARRVLAELPFLAGAAPAWPDYALFGAFMWARGVSAYPLLDPADPVHGWRGRMLDSHGGMPRREPGFPV